MVRIVHNLTLRPLNIARHLIPDIVWKLINFPLIISATLNVDHVSLRASFCMQSSTYGPYCEFGAFCAATVMRSMLPVFVCFCMVLANTVWQSIIPLA